MQKKKDTIRYMDKLAEEAAARTREKLETIMWQWPSLGTFLLDPSENFRGIQVKQSNSGGWIVILKRLSPSGLPQVCFNTEATALDAWLSVDRLLSENRWREDKPWKPKG